MNDVVRLMATGIPRPAIFTDRTGSTPVSGTIIKYRITAKRSSAKLTARRSKITAAHTN